MEISDIAAMPPGAAPKLHDTSTLAALYLRALRRFPSRVALVDEYESVTYAELERRAAAYASLLMRSGLRRGDALAQLTTNRADAVAVMLAAFAMGVRYTPLHPRGSLPDHAAVLEDAAIDALVVDELGFPNAVEALAAGAASPCRLFSFDGAPHCVPLRNELRSASGRSLEIQAGAQDIAAIFFTGGTTGRAKGVIHRQRSLVANTLIELAEFEWPREIRFLAVTPISHAAFAFILPVLLRGGTLVLRNGFSPQHFLDDVGRHSITATFLVPTMLNVLLDSPELRRSATASLEMVVYGASPMAPSRLSAALEAFGPVFVQLYGQTEAPNVITVLRKADHDPDRPDRLASCGVPVTGLDVRLLDPDGVEVGPGETGEICVRGPLVMEGYWNRPEETAAALQDGWLHTGDMARADSEGYLTIVDRKKDLIISGGFNVFPREVENVLAAHAAVAQVAVIGVPDPRWGEAVKALVVRRDGASVSEGELIEWVKHAKGSLLAPKSVEFVAAIPLTAVGKPDKKQLRASYWAGRDRQVN